MKMADAMTDEFIKNTVAMASGYATWFAGAPDAEVMQRLDEARLHMTADLAPRFGADAAAAIAAAFVRAVIRQKHDLEAAGIGGQSPS
jgi:hypothetical protein